MPHRARRIQCLHCGMEYAFPVLYLLVAMWVAFWVIRLAVRYGMDDALRKNSHWLRPRDDQDAPR